jgi:hypothetical protein
VHRPPRECRLSDFDAVSPWRPAFTWLAPAAIGCESRRRFVRALAADDAQMLFDGGWMIPLGQEHETRDLRRIMQALPAIPFYRVESPQQPAAVSLARHAKKTFIYAANEFAQPIRLTIAVSCPAGTPCRPLGPSPAVTIEAGEAAPNEAASAGGRIALTLDGYSLAAWEIDHEDVRVRNVQGELPPETLAALSGRIQAFDRRVAEVRRQSQRDEPGRSGDADDKPVGDGDGRDAGGRELPVTGAAYWSLSLKPPTKFADLQLAVGDDSSDAAPREQPVCRNALVVLRLRAEQPKTPVRLKFEATVGGTPVERHVDVEADTSWRRFDFRVEDLPGRGWPNARLCVEPRGGARVWVDGVSVDAQHLSTDDLRQLAKIDLALTLAWDEKRYADCQRLLDGYWARYVLFDPDQPIAAQAREARSAR